MWSDDSRFLTGHVAVRQGGGVRFRIPLMLYLGCISGLARDWADFLSLLPKSAGERRLAGEDGMTLRQTIASLGVVSEALRALNGFKVRVKARSGRDDVSVSIRAL